jgi:ribose transport system permease protein
VESGERERLRAFQRLLTDQPVIVLGVVLILLLILTDVVSPGYISPRQMSTTVLTAAILGVLAGGQTLVLLTAGVDLSVAATASAASYMMAAYASHGTFVAILIGLLVGLAIGTINGVGVGIFRVQPLIMTLGVSGIISGLLIIYSEKTNGAPVVPSAVRQLGSGTVFTYVPISLLVVWIPLSVILILGLKYTGLGRSIFAIGDNPVASRLAGIRVWQVQMATYAICGVLSAIAGLLLVGFTDAADVSLGTTYLLPSVAAAVIGGTSVFGGVGGYSGTILGALILTVLDSLLTLMNAAQSIKQILYGGIILVLAWIYSRVAGTA